jgi:homoserine dehydrogenase
MVGIAILGYGVVGSGVAKAIRMNGGLISRKTGIDLSLIKILDVLDFPDSPDAALMTRDIDEIMHDGRIGVVVETMGGTNAAYAFTKMALECGKHVVTSNKELVAEYGPELMASAEKCNVRYMFEASVGGGIPIIKPLAEDVAANDVSELTGILNGTTNYILTYMREHGADFADTLQDAQRKGYAEKNPADDIEGRDACRKLAIASSVAWGAFVDWKRVNTEGIANISRHDICRADELGCKIKLIANCFQRPDGKLEAFVAPAMVRRGNLIYQVDGVYNAVAAKGNIVGDLLFYGRGAGALPTASAVLADVLDIARGYGLCSSPAGGSSRSQDGSRPPKSGGANPRWDRSRQLDVVDASEHVRAHYVRATANDREAFAERLFKAFPDATLLHEFDGEESWSNDGTGGVGENGRNGGSMAYGGNGCGGGTGADAAGVVGGSIDATVQKGGGSAAAKGAEPLAIAFLAPAQREGAFRSKLKEMLEKLPGAAVGAVLRIID